MEGCTDPKVCARLGAISNEALGMLNVFEDAVAHLLPACPVAAKVFKKRKGAQISGICGGMKGGTGPKTGVEIRYYRPTEYKSLSMEEKHELRDLLPESKAIKGDNKNNKVKSDDNNIGDAKERKSLGNRISKAKLLPSRNSTKMI